MPVEGSAEPVSAVLRTDYVYNSGTHTIDVFQYDPLGRRTQTTLNESGVELRRYATVGLVNGNYPVQVPIQVETELDAAQRPVWVTNKTGNGNTVEQHDGILIRKYDLATGNVSMTHRTSLARGTNETGDHGDITRYVFDSAGNTLRQTDPAGNITHWKYDSLGRKTEESTIIDLSNAPGQDDGVTCPQFLSMCYASNS